MNFYEKFPDFNWKFYIEMYPDLQRGGINTRDKAIHHYIANGYREKRRICPIVKGIEKLYKIPFTDFTSIYKQASFSSGVVMFKERVFKKYVLQDYFDMQKPCLFFGIYNDVDLTKIMKHRGLRIIIWCGEDANSKNTHSNQTINEIKKLTNIIHISKSSSTHRNLMVKGISSILVDYNIVDTSIFYPMSKSGRKILIFNGQHKGREHIYGERYYTEVIRRLPQHEYIFSNNLDIEWREMSEIYKQCFIMLRLTESDGNANSVQECMAMRIPVIHNQSEYGLKWKSINDIIKNINRVFYG